jgi:NAD(P)-dependent dehydrogenase (short-subunit alcohol dehydrogenase family)
MENYLIIGGSSGIGKELALNLALENSVYVISRNATQSDLHPSIETFDADILVDDISDFIPDSLDGLVYCPGSINLKPFRSLKEEDFINDFNINVLGAIRATQQSLKALKKSAHPAVLFFSTVAVSTGMNFHSSIATAKGAIEGLTRSLAAEFAPKIRVNAIAPSLINTPLASKFLGNEKMQEAAKQRHPLKNYGQPHDVAKLAEFLLGKNASFVTGQIYGIDGGIGTLK